MKNLNYINTILTLLLSAFVVSCTTNDVDELEIPGGGTPSGEIVLIEDNSFGEYLLYLRVAGVTEVKETVEDADIYKYYIDSELAKNQSGTLNLSKASASITTLTKAGVRTAEEKIKKAGELKYFVNITGLILTSNELESINVTKLTKLETLNLNNNWIASLDLSKNINLVTLSYNASTKVDNTKKLAAIDLSNNVKLTSVILNGHPGTDFPIPAAIYNQLTTKEGVKSE